MSAGSRIRVRLRGHDLIREPLLNKGSAFTASERDEFGLHGLLPARTLSIELQGRRVMNSLARVADPLGKFVELAGLQDRNEHLYFHVLVNNLEALMPIVYTPTVGLATRRFSHVFRRGRGVWITPAHRGSVAKVLAAAIRGRDIRLIVATDNESILGIGDQGAGGMAISIGKLALYTAIAGIDPAQVLPVSLDVGTDNEELLNDELYLGYPHRRLRGESYDSLLEEFVQAVRQVAPQALVQWEDLRKDNALSVLDRFRGRLASFNDDIQGTGAVALAGLLAAGRIRGKPLAGERIVILGAGAAGLGIARQIRVALAGEGLDPVACRRAVAVLDSRGLIVDDGSVRDPYKAELAWARADAADSGLRDDQRDFAGLVSAWRPTALIGTSGQAGAFTEAIVRQMTAWTDRPVILPLSNPTDNAEATPEDLYRWTGGRALVATGSPFPPLQIDNRSRAVGQGNNAFIFPAVGLAVLASGMPGIPDEAFRAAAAALADSLTPAELADGMLFPAISRSREVCSVVARAVIEAAVENGWCPKMPDHDIANRLARSRWAPVYREYEAV